MKSFLLLSAGFGQVSGASYIAFGRWPLGRTAQSRYGRSRYSSNYVRRGLHNKRKDARAAGEPS